MLPAAILLAILVPALATLGFAGIFAMIRVLAEPGNDRADEGADLPWGDVHAEGDR